MSKMQIVQQTGQVGRRGTIVLSAATRRRYGLEDGSLYISEEREEGVLIRPAVAVPADLEDVRRKIKTGLDQLKRGEGIPGQQVEAELKRMSEDFRAKRR
jgi:bifunctional DNA-binding transcriptional regulator/antitoxin component of YhaV-PrlF toxin-antitoxin module